MARILAITSQVVRGHVGLSAAVPALQRLGHEVWPLPTILLSNHPGHQQSAGKRIEAGLIADMVAALEGNGWLDEVEAVLTGYLPSRGHVEVAAKLVARLRRVRRDLLYICDPVLGDDPKGLYIDLAAAEAIRDELLGLADLATPNRMELAFLSGREVGSIDQAARALSCLSSGGGMATSIPAAAPETLANMLSHGSVLAITRVPQRSKVPHGTGDLMAALLLGHMLCGAGPVDALGLATAGVDLVLNRSTERDELQLTAALALIDAAAPWPVESLGWRSGAAPAVRAGPRNSPECDSSRRRSGVQPAKTSKSGETL